MGEKAVDVFKLFDGFACTRVVRKRLCDGKDFPSAEERGQRQNIVERVARNACFFQKTLRIHRIFAVDAGAHVLRLEGGKPALFEEPFEISDMSDVDDEIPKPRLFEAFDGKGDALCVRKRPLFAEAFDARLINFAAREPSAVFQVVFIGKVAQPRSVRIEFGRRDARDGERRIGAEHQKFSVRVRHLEHPLFGDGVFFARKRLIIFKPCRKDGRKARQRELSF